jgi:hypothetical protein
MVRHATVLAEVHRVGAIVVRATCAHADRHASAVRGTATGVCAGEALANRPVPTDPSGLLPDTNVARTSRYVLSWGRSIGSPIRSHLSFAGIALGCDYSFQFAWLRKPVSLP